MSDAPQIGLLAAYNGFLSSGDLKPDAEQLHAAQKLEALNKSLFDKTKKIGLITKLFCYSRKINPKGFYIFGDVGRGKSMMMDLFFVHSDIDSKKRVHFHAFMLECHATIHQWRKLSDIEKKHKGFGDDPIPPLAEKIAKSATLLCFDEFQVTDVADAMILGRLYEELFKRGVTIVSTSNRSPNDLYKGGLNRDLFKPFIEKIKGEMEVLELNGPNDYRYNRIKGIDVYHTPIDRMSTQRMRDAFFAMTDRDVEDADEVPTAELQIGGRSLHVPKSSKGVAVFSFKRLCDKPLAAADYLAISWAYHTVFIVAIPKLDKNKRDQAKRFVMLIDTLYENNVKLICSAEVYPQYLYPKGDGSFEFKRTISRLIEMQSQEYLARGHAV